jgi:hypothetical protein
MADRRTRLAVEHVHQGRALGRPDLRDRDRSGGRLDLRRRLRDQPCVDWSQLWLGSVASDVCQARGDRVGGRFWHWGDDVADDPDTRLRGLDGSMAPGWRWRRSGRRHSCRTGGNVREEPAGRAPDSVWLEVERGNGKVGDGHCNRRGLVRRDVRARGAFGRIAARPENRGVDVRSWPDAERSTLARRALGCDVGFGWDDHPEPSWVRSLAC